MAQDEKWLNDLIRKHYSALFRSVYSYLGNEAAAQDIVDDVFARIWDNREDISARSGMNIAGYLFAAVRNRALNELNSERYAERRRIIMQATDEHPGIAQRASSPEEATEASERRDIIWSAISQLPEHTRAILTMRWQHQLAWDEIATALGLTPAAVKMAHSRALQSLRERLPAFFADSAER